MSYECHSAGMNTGCLLDALQKAFQIELGENVRCFCGTLSLVLLHARETAVTGSSLGLSFERGRKVPAGVSTRLPIAERERKDR
ncbi:hypothetical protein M0802_001170 [Mischocyttarus mexicanus]|nr:hypothetical protein M0802_001170 [Mischocyttarus mexicanus]